MTLDVITSHYQPDHPRALCVLPKSQVDNLDEKLHQANSLSQPKACVGLPWGFTTTTKRQTPSSLPRGVRPALRKREKKTISSLPRISMSHTFLLLHFFSIMVFWSHSSALASALPSITPTLRPLHAKLFIVCQARRADHQNYMTGWHKSLLLLLSNSSWAGKYVAPFSIWSVLKSDLSCKEPALFCRIDDWQTCALLQNDSRLRKSKRFQTAGSNGIQNASSDVGSMI